jgi:predicted double-glycine peptidase
MDASIGWFIGIAALAVGAWSGGVYLGRGPRWRPALIIGMLMLGGWAWLIHHPAVAVRAIPLPLLSRIEGVAAVPIFMMIVGIALGRSHLPRQKRLALWATLLGSVYFLQGGFWLLQVTPQVGLAQTIEHGPIKQSQDYSCVPAATATTLNLLGFYTTEAEMARLTDTRAGTGSTMIRAMNGLNRRLQGTSYTVELIEPTVRQLRVVRLPALVPLQFEATRRHMVTILEVDSEKVRIADPLEGTINLLCAEFEQAYRNQVLVFRPRSN